MEDKAKSWSETNPTGMPDEMWNDICDLTDKFNVFDGLREDAQKIIKISIGDFKQV